MSPTNRTPASVPLSSVKQREANRRNAQNSTGPRTAEGKRRSAVNAVRHGLSAASRWMWDDPVVLTLTERIEQEGIDRHTAMELAQRIVTYERNLEYQRRRYVQETSEKEYAPLGTSAGTGIQPLNQDDRGTSERVNADEFMPELLWLDDRRLLRNVKQMHLLKEKLKRMKEQMEKQRMRREVQESERSVRYLKRATNQLIKGFKALKDQA